MTQTLISTEPLLALYEEKLFDLSVRWIEQFVCKVDAAGLQRMAQYLDLSEDQLKKLIEDVKAHHPEMVLPEHRDEEYSLGYRID
ncbi:MAG: hypothetical protein HY225_01345 [Candidatus Vogelbacteria bacterium]|nr:hypothetical protein [Candidatus Vogelbacteria bacterium]